MGINNRDLRDFSVDYQRTFRLMEESCRRPRSSESGIATAEQLRRLDERGVQAVLVGESLMRSADPAAVVRKLSSLRHI